MTNLSSTNYKYCNSTKLYLNPAITDFNSEELKFNTSYLFFLSDSLILYTINSSN